MTFLTAVVVVHSAAAGLSRDGRWNFKVRWGL